MGWVEDDWSASTQHQPLLSVRTEYDDDRRQSCGTPHRSSLATLHEDEAFSPPVDGNTSPVHKWPSQSSIFAAQEGAPELTFIIRTQSRVGAVGAENADQVITDVNVTEAVQDVVQDVLQVVFAVNMLQLICSQYASNHIIAVSICSGCSAASAWRATEV